MTQTYSIQGRVLTADGKQPLAGVVLRAFSNDLPYGQAPALTDDRGRYTLAYRPAPMQNAQAAARIVVRAFGRDGKLLGESRPVNAGPVVQVPDFIVRQSETGKSEYAQVVEQLAQRQNSNYADWTEDDVTVLAERTGIDRRLLETLHEAAQLARPSDLTIEALYGLIREGEPADLAGIGAKPATALRRSLDAAVTRNIVSAASSPRLDDILRRIRCFAQRPITTAGQLVDENTGRTLPGLQVKIEQTANGETLDLGFEQTLSDGKFSLTYYVPDNGREDSSDVTLRFTVRDPRTMHSVTTAVTAPVTAPDVFPVRVPSPVPTRPTITVAELQQTLSFTLPPAVKAYLKQKGLNTLEDICNSGGLKPADGLNRPQDRSAVELLNAHVDLSRISSDPKVNAALIGKGYSSVLAIAETPRADFVQVAHSVIGDLAAAQMHAVARAQTEVLNNALAGIAALHANGVTTGPLHALQAQLFAEQCNCPDCDSAVSPLAYLADLLNYTVNYVKHGNVLFTLPFLTDTLMQPFQDLPADCEAEEERVHQLRICIEVLRKYLVFHPPSPAQTAALSQAEQKYLRDTYELLLNKVGTTAVEIRQARTQPDDKRIALADRLGIPLTVPRPPEDELDQLFLDPSAPANDPHALTEKALERLLGFADTLRDPLSDGDVFGDTKKQIGRWNLQGVTWGQNTDPNGRIYLNLTQPSPGHFQIDLFRDAPRTQLVASGTAGFGFTTVQVLPQNNSNLSGSIAIAFSADATDIQLPAVPAFLSWRLRAMRRDWVLQDRPQDSYSDTSKPVLPFIDPDLIGPDDFRLPYAKANAADPDRAFDLWLARRKWVDDQLKVFSAVTRTLRGQQEPDLAALFASMYNPVTYRGFTKTAWAATTPVTDFDTLLANLQRGVDFDGTRERIETDLRMGVEQFSRLMEIRTKDKGAERDIRNPMVIADEWSELLSLLVEARKAAFFADWRNEEQSEGIRLGPGDFWIALREPQAGVWPPVSVASTPWIDPDIEKLTDLPDALVGAAARTLYANRRTELVTMRQTLQNIRESIGFDAMMKQALGHPNPGDPLPHHLDALQNALSSSNPGMVATAKQQITQDLFLSLDDFQQLMSAKANNDNLDPLQKPTDADWESLYPVLASAEKRKRSYPVWITQEQAQKLNTEYWRAREAALPAWRSDADARRDWQDALRTRMQLPIIDPDLIGPGDMRLPFPGNDAFDLWSARDKEINDPATGLIAKQQATRTTAANPLAGFDAIVQQVLGITGADLTAIAVAATNGEDTSTRLDQLSLSFAAFNFLARIRDLAVSGLPILDSEWADTCSILAQVWKMRHSAAWRDEEQTHAIVLASDFFQLPPTEQEPFTPIKPVELPAWRATLSDRLNWQATLQARNDQQAAEAQAMHDIVSDTEEAKLPDLRDSLILATDMPGSTLKQQAEQFGAQLLIDVEAGGCQLTTRIEQAIETIQELLLNARIGEGPYTLHDDNFDEKWKWLGAYSTWRSAMLVFLYEEDTLYPTLRRWQSPGFASLLQSLPSGNPITPEKACQAAAVYSDYFHDIAKLTLDASCQAATSITHTDPCSGPPVAVTHYTCYVFGRGGATGSVYWSMYDPNDGTDHAHSFWDYVPHLQNVARVVGAVPYRTRDGNRWLFLFVEQNQAGGQQLAFIRYSLNQQFWEGGTTPLRLPSIGQMEIVAVQTQSEDRPPEIALHSGDTIYVRSLNRDGTDWEMQPGANEWDPFLVKKLLWAGVNVVIDPNNPQSLSVKTLYAVLAAHTIESSVPLFDPFNKDPRMTYWFCFTDTTGELYVYRLLLIGFGVPLGAMSIGADLGKNEWVGALLWDIVPGQDQDGMYAFYRTGGTGYLLPVNNSFTGSLQTFSGSIDRLIWNSCVIPSNITRMIAYSWPFIPSISDLNHTGVTLALGSAIPLYPFAAVYDIPGRLSSEELQIRRLIEFLTYWFEPPNLMPPDQTYLDEAYYFVPIYIALLLQQQGLYLEALDWFRTAYDYTAPQGTRKIAYLLTREETISPDYSRDWDWLLDPLNPHLIAATRPNAYTRFTLMAIVRCLLDYADSEFTHDTSESVSRARELYTIALALLDSPDLYQPGECGNMVGTLHITVGAPKWDSGWLAIRREIALIRDLPTLKQVVGQTKKILAGDEDLAARLAKVHQFVTQTRAREPRPTLSQVLQKQSAFVADAHRTLLTEATLLQAAARAGRSAADDFARSAQEVVPQAMQNKERARADLPWLRESRTLVQLSKVVQDTGTPPILRALTALTPAAMAVQPSTMFAGIAETAPLAAFGFAAQGMGSYVPRVVYTFCIPKDSVRESLQMRAELALYKIRSCRNIAGLKRELEPYSAPTDTSSGLPALTSPAISLPSLQPTQYRYDTLIERAKQQVQVAAQMEAAMLTALEKQDAEAYTYLKARQDLSLAEAGVRLHDLRVKQANDGVTLAEMQQARAQLQAAHLQSLLAAPVSHLEQQALDYLDQAAGFQADASTFGFMSGVSGGATGAAEGAALGATVGSIVPGVGTVIGAIGGAVIGGILGSSSGVSSGYSSVAGKYSTRASWSSMQASYERRQQEWEFQNALAQQDMEIGGEQILLARDQVDVASQERLIAGIQADNDRDTVVFLQNKFTNVELYAWMSNVLERIYSYFLQQATVMARLGQLQLAFQRQEIPPSVIQSDYWQPLTTDMVSVASADRRGLTGSARLLQDISQLDQYAFETNQRKLQISKTISLAQMMPVEFQQFCQTGVIRFATPMEMFDRDFPGHYLRLIKQVRTSVVALVPPVQGIHAVLANNGISRVVIGGDRFETSVIRREPEQVALSATTNASGLFDLQPQSSDLLLPFEGTGVDTTWELSLPRSANQFDFTTFADVLITTDYTALPSQAFQQQVLRSLQNQFSADNAFSFRNQFADAWYDLHNPDQTATPMTVRFTTRRQDFPPNLQDLTIQQVVLYFSRVANQGSEISVRSLRFTEQGHGAAVGGAATTVNGAISTRWGNAGSWQAMLGKTPVGDWELSLPSTDEVRQLFQQNKISDILFVLTFSGQVL